MFYTLRGKDRHCCVYSEEGEAEFPGDCCAAAVSGGDAKLGYEARVEGVLGGEKSCAAG